MSMGHDDALPRGWEIAKVGDIADVVEPGFPCGRHNAEGRGIPHLRPMNVSGQGTLCLDEIKYVEVQNPPLLEDGDILFNNTNSPEWVGKTTTITEGEKYTFSNHMTRVRLNKYAGAPKFFALQLHYLQRRGYFFERCTHHVNQASIASSYLADKVSLLVPPVPEQHRIVSVIEQQFSRLDESIATLQRDRRGLKRARASVLKHAVEGKLTEQWCAEHPATEPASKLFQRILDERRAKWEAEQLAKMQARGVTPKDDAWKRGYKEPAAPDTSRLPELPERWCYTFLLPLLSTSRKGIVTGPFGSLLKKHEHRSDGVPVFGIENIAAMRFIPGSRIYITQNKASELSQYDALPDDILISRSGTVGEICVVPENLGEARISTNLIRVSLARNGMLPQFFCLLFNGSPLVLDQVSELCKGSTRNFLSQTILYQIVFPLPPLAEQEQIVAEVEERLSVIEASERAIEASLKRIERLRQDILQDAFAGRLVPQDPADEPASVLLERIREERARREQSEKAKKPLKARVKSIPAKLIKVPDGPPEPIDATGVKQEELW